MASATTTQTASQLHDLGAYPLKHHLVCRERTRKDVSYDDSLKEPPTPGLAMRMQEGIEFEDDICGKLTDEHPDRVVTIEFERDSEGKAQAERDTLAAMKDGALIIIDGRLRPGNGKVGEPDILIREDWSDDAPTPYAYLGIDVKNHKPNEGTAKPKAWKISTLTDIRYQDAVPTAVEGRPRLDDSLQLVHYWYMLDAVGHAGSRVGGILANTEEIMWRDLDRGLYRRTIDGSHVYKSAFELYDETWDSLISDQLHEKARMYDGSLEPLTGPQRISACKECPWRTVCADELAEADHITLLQGLTARRAVPHYQQGNDTIVSLAHLDTATAAAVDLGLDVPRMIDVARGDTLEAELAEVKLAGGDPVTDLLEAVDTADPADAALQLAAYDVTTVNDVRRMCDRTAAYAGSKVYDLVGTIDQARVTKVERVHRARGITKVDLPRARVELDLDIEDDGICYLIGINKTVRTDLQKPTGSTQTITESEYIPFVAWEKSDDAEARVFAAFWEFLTEERTEAADNGGLKVYYYTQHETRYFKHIVEKNTDKDGKPLVDGMPTMKELEAFFDSGDWVDMYPILKDQLVWPTEDMSLKTIAKYCKFMWRDEDPGGANSIAWFREALNHPDPDVREAAKQRNLAYNEDDCLATLEIRNFISRMEGEVHQPGVKLPSVTDSKLHQRFVDTERRAA